jgi:hypothetical protein
MYTVEIDTKKDVKVRNIFGNLPEIRQENELDGLLAELSPDVPWGTRRAAARKRTAWP